MPIPVTRTKIIPPRRRSEIITRQRLIDLLFDLMDYKLIIVAAPAGYGKTSLLIDFAYQADLTVCWLTLDTLDRDIYRFIAHLIASIEYRFPQFGEQARASLEANTQTKVDLDTLVSTIVNEAYEHIREHFVLVLDDYHLVNEQKEINTFISRLAQELDENCHLVLSSRALLAIPDMPLLVARSMVGGLSFEELAFHPDEIQQLLESNYQVKISHSNAEELCAATEGWITGLLLSSEARQLGLKDRLRLAHVSRVGLYDYLAQQVFENQTSQIQKFLLMTSVFNEFNLEMCKALLGEGGDWDQAFRYILENNLFVLPVGEDGQHLRYHHLFHEFLQQRVREQFPEEHQSLLKKLIDYYAELGDWDQAHATAIQLGNRQILVDTILRAGPVLINNGRLALLAEWIDALPFEISSKDPGLLLLRAYPEMVLGQGDRGVGLLNQAIDGFRARQDSTNLAIALARRAHALRLMGKYRESILDAQESLASINDSPEMQIYKATALRALGVSQYYSGIFDDAIENLEKALKLYQALGEKQTIATTFMDLGFFLMGAGKYQKGLDYYNNALKLWDEVKNPFRQANLLNNLGVLNHLMGNYENAASIFEQALVLVKKNRYPRMEAYIYASIGDLYADLSGHKAALDVYQKSHDLAKIINFNFLILYCDLAMAAVFREMGDLIEARHLLRSASELINSNSSIYERGLYELEAGRLSLLVNQFGSGIKSIQEAYHLFQEAGRIADAARACLLLSNAYYLTGDLTKAQSLIEESISLANKLDTPHVLVITGIEAKPLLEEMKKHSTDKSVEKLLARVLSFETRIPSIRKRIRSRANPVIYTPPKLTIQALGRNVVELDGKPIMVPEWQNQRKVREIFFYLLTKPSGATKEEIGVMFWPESSSSQLKLQFKNAIYRLRHSLGPDIVLFDEERYWFNMDLDYDYDVESFIKNIEAAESALSDEEKIDCLRAGISQYQGHFLPEIDGFWVEQEREHLRRKCLKAIGQLAELYYRRSAYNSALEYCLKALEIDPCLEEMHRLAMRAYAEIGNRAAVNRQYEQCKLWLNKEINSSPSPQTTQLYESLIR